MIPGESNVIYDVDWGIGDRVGPCETSTAEKRAIDLVMEPKSAKPKVSEIAAPCFQKN
jgi:hypothetical protein